MIINRNSSYLLISLEFVKDEQKGSEIQSITEDKM